MHVCFRYLYLEYTLTAGPIATVVTVNALEITVYLRQSVMLPGVTAL